MLAKVVSCALVGLEGQLVDVEVDISQGMTSLVIVGLPDAAVNESKERVRAAIANSGLPFPRGRITVNLAPADVRKEGPAYDLPIAVGLLIAIQQVWPVESMAFIGELSLDGSVRHTDGILPMAAVARERGVRMLFVPTQDAAEAALIDGLTVYGVGTLPELVAHLRGMRKLTPTAPRFALDDDEAIYATDFREIRGQEHVKRALEVAAAGGHNLLMTGSPGAGKTLMARALPGVLPRLTLDESLEVTKIYSIAGLLPPSQPLIRQRPFRAPHHTISHAGLVGGGGIPRPGEITLAHQGVLFLDELPEFNPRTLEVMRQPLEDRIVTISRANGSLTFPANFQLIGAMNPCPCGWFGDNQRECTCSASTITRYQKRISGPLLDRIDIHIDVPRVDYDKLLADRLSEPSSAIRARVEAARAIQRDRLARPLPEDTLSAQRNGGLLNKSNADMGPAEVREYCKLDEPGKALVKAAMTQLQLSARAFHRILKLARTIADLDGSDAIKTHHLAEALQYRPRRQM
ncbi:MAG: YifB family Mg chelatase-like AAA ATPase [Anaerolineae bacterium]